MGDDDAPVESPPSPVEALEGVEDEASLIIVAAASVWTPPWKR